MTEIVFTQEKIKMQIGKLISGNKIHTVEWNTVIQYCYTSVTVKQAWTVHSPVRTCPKL